MKRFALSMMLLLGAVVILPGCRLLDWSGNRNQNVWNEMWAKKEIVDEHNKIRLSHNLGRFKTDSRLNAAAQKHANYMANKDRLSHYGEWYSRPSTRIEKEGYEYWGVAENIASGQTSVQEVMEAWMNSRGHRTNILGNYSEIGVGIARNENGRIYWCVVFARPQYDR